MFFVKRFIAVCFLCGLTSLGLYAQVTIGSDQLPNEGALLDLKERGPFSGTATATKGLLLPRVKLIDVKPPTGQLATVELGLNRSILDLWYIMP